jgi:hypothetical protein
MGQMKAGILIACGLSMFLALSKPGHAQCAGINCTSLPKPPIRLDFGAAPKQPAPRATPARPALKTAPALPAEPIDCAILKPVEPNFTSNMRVVTPDPNLSAVMRTVVMPACPKP